MDDINGLEILVNGEERDEEETLTFSDIPNNYDADTVMDTTPTDTNSFKVEFSQDVDLNVVSIGEIASGGEEIDMNIIITDENGDILDGTDGNPITSVIPLEGGEFILPANFPPVKNITIIIVSSSVPSIELSTDFLGCLLPSMYML